MVRSTPFELLPDQRGINVVMINVKGRQLVMLRPRMQDAERLTKPAIGLLIVTIQPKMRTVIVAGRVMTTCGLSG
jgi:hypothetical protein